MQIAMIGLGRMGANMVRRLLEAGHGCVVYDRDPAAVQALVQEGAIGAADLADLCARLEPPRNCWIMVFSCAMSCSVAAKADKGENNEEDTASVHKARAMATRE